MNCYNCDFCDVTTDRFGERHGKCINTESPQYGEIVTSFSDCDEFEEYQEPGREESIRY